MKNILFVLFFYFAILVNGTEQRKPLLLISFDGFKADKLDEFLQKYPNSHLNNFIKNGVKARYMKPSFPSLTFPNHWTIVTGI